MAARTLSVCVITYNHARYIRECLQSILDQRAAFDFEVIIGDDCSTDGTAAIVDEFATRFPRIIRPIKYAGKVGGTANMFAVHNEAVGEFVAHLDGDDLMLPGKLQRQVDFLRAHSDHAFVAHDMRIIDENSQVIGTSFNGMRVPESTDLRYLIANGCFFAHSSKMYRRGATRLRSRDRPTVDLYFHIEQAQNGLVGYIPEALGCYRRTTVGLSSSQSIYRREVADGHLDAYAYALQVGVPPEIVNPAKLNFRYVHAMRYARRGQVEDFRALASPNKDELRWATWRQRAVFAAPSQLVAVAVRTLDGLRRATNRLLGRELAP